MISPIVSPRTLTITRHQFSGGGGARTACVSHEYFILSHCLDNQNHHHTESSTADSSTLGLSNKTVCQSFLRITPLGSMYVYTLGGAAL
jgi:hypothetical protein